VVLLSFDCCWLLLLLFVVRLLLLFYCCCLVVFFVCCCFVCCCCLLLVGVGCFEFVVVVVAKIIFPLGPSVRGPQLPTALSLATLGNVESIFGGFGLGGAIQGQSIDPRSFRPKSALKK